MRTLLSKDLMKHKNCYYHEIDYSKKEQFYKVLYPSRKKSKTEIEEGYKYRFFEINGKLYEGLITNNPIKIINELKIAKGLTKMTGFTYFKKQQKIKQLSIFDL